MVLVRNMARMMEVLAPSSVNQLQPGRPGKATGLAGAVYDQMREEFFVAGPFVVHGEVPSLLAASWSLVRETLFVGDAPRGDKEIIAWAVSQANECPFCVDAHGAAKRAASADDPALAQWARASATKAGAGEAGAPTALADHPAEYLATLAAFHYLNRMVSAFLDEKMMPVPGAMDAVTHPMARFMMGGMIDKARDLEPGASLALLPDHDGEAAWRPSWAASSQRVSAALAGWSAIVEQEASMRFAPEILAPLVQRFGQWEGGETLAELPPVDADPLVRIAALVAEQPFRVTQLDVEAAVEASSSTDALVIAAWAAQRAARRCTDWTAAASLP